MKIILLGYMGSGKTGAGKLLAEKMEVPFLDLDSEIIKSEKREIPEIFESSGEIYFRKKESEVLRQIIYSRPDNFILSVGGGTPCYGGNLQLLKENPDVKLIYLKTSLQELTSRLFAEKENRPLISHLGSKELLEDFIRKHLFERAYYYNQSNLIVETDNRNLEEVAQKILLELEQGKRSNLKLGNQLK